MATHRMKNDSHSKYEYSLGKSFKGRFFKDDFSSASNKSLSFFLL